MDYTFIIKKKFLNQSVDKFASSFNRMNYKDFENLVTKNTYLGMGGLAVKLCRKNVKSVFDSVDGVPLNINNTTLIRKDGYVDTDEMYQLIKDSYKRVNGHEITKEELSKMTIKEAIDLIIKSYEKLEK